MDRLVELGGQYGRFIKAKRQKYRHYGRCK